MRATFTRFVVAVAVLAWSSSAAAQTVDEVIEKHLAALGGRAALAKLDSRFMVGTFTLSTPGGDVAGPIEVLNQRPNKARTLINLDLSALGAGAVRIDQRFDGTDGYVLDSMQGDRPIGGSQLETMRSSIFPTQYLDYKERGATVELKGKEKIGEREAYQLVFTSKGGSPVRQYFDAETFLPVRIVMNVEVPGVGMLDQTSDFSDMREVDGVKVPFLVKSSSAVQSFSITVTRVEHNGTVDQTLFVKPAPK